MYLVSEDVQIIKPVGITITRTKKKMYLLDVSILNQANFSSTVIPLNSLNTLYYGLLFTLQAEIGPSIILLLCFGPTYLNQATFWLSVRILLTYSKP